MASMFKWDQPSRVDARLKRDTDAERDWRAVCKAVDLRDKRTCRACGKKTDPDATGLLRGHRHHIVYRSAGGATSTLNVITLCAKCHSDEHRHRLRIEGNADDGVRLWRKDEAGEWFVSQREVSPGVVERD